MSWEHGGDSTGKENCIRNYVAFFVNNGVASFWVLPQHFFRNPMRRKWRFPTCFALFITLQHFAMVTIGKNYCETYFRISGKIICRNRERERESIYARKSPLCYGHNILFHSAICIRSVRLCDISIIAFFGHNFSHMPFFVRSAIQLLLFMR